MRRFFLGVGLAASLSAERRAKAESDVFAWRPLVQRVALELKSGESAQRTRALKDLETFPFSMTRPYVVRALNDSDPQVRDAAMNILSRNRDRLALPTLVDWLSSPVLSEREQAAVLLKFQGDASAIPPLLRTLNDPIPALQILVIEALGGIGDKAVVSELRPFLASANPELRFAAARALSSLKFRDASDALLDCIDDPDPKLRLICAPKAGQAPSSKSGRALLSLLDDESEAVQAVVLDALADQNETRVLRALKGEVKKMSRHRIKSRRQSLSARRALAERSLAVVANRLQEIAPSLASQSIMLLLDELGNASSEGGVFLSLAQSGSFGAATLAKELSSPGVKNPRAIVRLLGALKEKAAVPALLRELQGYRVEAPLIFDALSRIGAREAVVPMMRLLKRGEGDINARIYQALRACVTAESPGVEVLLDHLRWESSSNVDAIVEILGHMRNPIAAPALIDVAIDESRAVETRKRALRALSQTNREVDARRLAPLLRSAALQIETSMTLAAGSDLKIAPLLRQIAVEGDHASRRAALRALFGLTHRHPSSLQPSFWRQFVREDDLALTLISTETLGLSKDPEDRDILLSLAQDGGMPRRASAYRALGHLPGHSSISAAILRGLQSDVGGLVAAAALGASGHLNKTIIEKLARLLEHPTERVAVNASYTLAVAGVAKAYERISRHRNPNIRSNASLMKQLASGSKGTSSQSDSMKSWRLLRVTSRAVESNTADASYAWQAKSGGAMHFSADTDGFAYFNALPSLDYLVRQVATDKGR